MKTKEGRKAILDFLAELRGHNDRDWFEAHRDSYAAARSAHEALVAELIASFEPVDDLGGVAPADCVFRIFRDVRFSGDKSPYKTAMGAVLGPEGRKSSVRSYYLHIEAGGLSFLAGGLHSPAPAELAAVRAAVGRDAATLRSLLAAPAFARRFGGLSGETLKTAPQGWPKDHPDIDLLRHRQFLAVEAVSDGELLDAGFVARALKSYAAMKPFLLWLESAIAQARPVGSRR